MNGQVVIVLLSTSSTSFSVLLWGGSSIQASNVGIRAMSSYLFGQLITIIFSYSIILLLKVVCNTCTTVHLYCKAQLN